MSNVTKMVTIQVAETILSQLIARAEAGEEIIIARGKSLVARLVPVRHVTAKRQFGAMRGKARVSAAFFERLPEDE